MTREPKRIKLDTDGIEVKAILPDEFLELPATINFIAAKIVDKKQTNKLIIDLNTKLPIDCISFVRRVFKDEILVCPHEEIKEVNGDDDRTRLKNYLTSKNISESMVDEIMKEEFRIIKIYESSPILRWQAEKMTCDWPCKFHKKDYIESLYNNTLFSESELASHGKYMEVCKYLSTELENDNVGIAVNPYNNRIVACGYSKSTLNPVVHCAMDLIDQVAITQNGGVWATEHDEKYLEVTKKAAEKFNVEFGEELFEKQAASSDNLLKFGPYLCTGYLIYLLKEPCMMCSMALVHARSKRVFYHHTSANGTLGSITKLHTNKNLNHRYEAFHITNLS